MGRSSSWGRAVLPVLASLLAVAYLDLQHRAIGLQEQADELEHALGEHQREVNEARALREALVRRDLGLPTQGVVSVQETVLRAREYVYRRTLVGPDVGYLPPFERYLRLSAAGGITQLCGGMAQTYVWLLEALGMPARTVQLASSAFLEGRDYYGTHVTVEVWYGDKWRLSDPTFNCGWRTSTASDLSLVEAMACVRAGQPLEPVYGPTVMAGRQWRDQRLTFPELLAAYKTASARIGAVYLPSEQHPHPGWISTALLRYASPSS